MHRRLTLLLFVALLIAACGGGDDGGSDGAATTTSERETADQVDAEFDPEGIVRIAYDLVGAAKGGFSWNPRDSTTNVADLGLYHMVYGGLMRPAPDGSLVPDLAEDAEVVDETTIDVTLRDGVTFGDGSPLTAEVVKAQLEANLSDPELPAFQASFHSLESVEVTGPLSVRLNVPDGTAASWYDNFLGGVEAVILPPDVDFSSPTGAGPFRITRFQPEQRIDFEKNPDYWNADEIKIAGVEAIHVSPEGQSGVSALAAGQIDFARIDHAQVDAIGRNHELLIEPTPGNLTSFMICKETEPFDDARVRLALSRAVDRDAINDALYAGTGVPAYGVWPEGHRFYLEGLDDDYGYDPDAARELLAEADLADGFSFDLMTMTVAGMPEVAEIVQQQWAEIGVDARIVPSPNFVQDFLIDRKGPLGIIPVLGLTPRLNQWTAEATNNPCQYRDPELNEMAAEIATLSNEDQRAVDLWQEVQAKMAEEALSIFVIYASSVHAYDTERLADVAVPPYHLVVPDVWNLYVKA
jgi:peptide/nickel transport system substrate-binding protein